MYGLREDQDDERCTCSYCGASYYPEVGPPGHICAEKRASWEADRRAKGYEDEVVGFVDGDWNRPIIKRRYF